MKHEVVEVDLKSIRALVAGRVQGVGFRYFVLQQARRLGLTGYTRNLRDGSVEVVALGEQASIQSLIQQLHRGPAGSRVEAVRVEDNAPGRTQPGALDPNQTTKFEILD